MHVFTPSDTLSVSGATRFPYNTIAEEQTEHEQKRLCQISIRVHEHSITSKHQYTRAPAREQSRGQLDEIVKRWAHQYTSTSEHQYIKASAHEHMRKCTEERTRRQEDGERADDQLSSPAGEKAVKKHILRHDRRPPQVPPFCHGFFCKVPSLSRHCIHLCLYRACQPRTPPAAA